MPIEIWKSFEKVKVGIYLGRTTSISIGRCNVKFDTETMVSLLKSEYVVGGVVKYLEEYDGKVDFIQEGSHFVET